MLSAGIDLGAQNTKVVIVKDDKEIVAKGTAVTGFDQKASAEEALDSSLKKAGISQNDLTHVIGTGVGKNEAPGGTGQVSEISADARGGYFLHPSARVVVDVGAEEGRAVRLDDKGKVKDFAVNEKCAAGAGAFVEAMARALETTRERFAQMPLESTKNIPMNAQCVIFAESEVVSLIHAKTPHPDISKAIHDAIADRISAMVRRVGIEKDIILVGGVARNIGFVESFKRILQTDVIVPDDPEYVTALGAALSHE
jgi:benzoyl-CoA reductase subunit D